MPENCVYLSELFLKVVGDDYSNVSVKKALYKCNDEFSNRISKYKLNCIPPSSKYRQELIDFYDVYSEFENELKPFDENELFILLEMYKAIGG